MSLGLLSACASTKEIVIVNEPLASENIAVVAAATPDAIKLGPGLSGKTGRSLSVPRELLQWLQVKSTKGALRQGPGIQFELEDQLLEGGQRVVALMRSELWVYVWEPESKAKGWLHQEALGPLLVEEEGRLPATIMIDVAALPTVFTKAEVGLVQSYPDREPRKVAISSGQPFLALRSEAKEILLLTPGQDGVFYLKRSYLDLEP
jgi:hypothetical protein